MAIVKVTYTKKKGPAKANVRYIENRAGEGGKKIRRELFGIDGFINRQQAYEMIDEAEKGTNFFRIIISPDPNKEDERKDLRLWEITALTMLKLEEKLNQQVNWVAAVHDDHTPNRHMHLLACVKDRLTAEHFKSLRETATKAAQFQKIERDLAAAAKIQEPKQNLGPAQEVKQRWPQQ